MATDEEYLFQASHTGPRMQAVIDADGGVHRKHVDPAKMRPSDVALQLFFRTEEGGGEMTPAQREAALRLVRSASQHLLTLLGAPEEGFRPGMVVCVEGDETGRDCYGYVVRETQAGLLLRTLTPEGAERITHVPFAQRMDEVPGQPGLPGLVAAELLGSGSLLSLDVAIRLLERVSDEQALVRLALGEGTGGAHPQWSEGIRKAAAGRVTSQEALVKLCRWRQRDHHRDVCDALSNDIADNVLARITDQACLLRIVRNLCGTLSDERWLGPVVERITDQTTMIEAICVLVNGLPSHRDGETRGLTAITLAEKLNVDEGRLCELLDVTNHVPRVAAAILARLAPECAAGKLAAMEVDSRELVIRALHTDDLVRILPCVPPDHPEHEPETGLHRQIEMTIEFRRAR